MKKNKTFTLLITVKAGSPFQADFLKGCLETLGKGAEDLKNYHKKNQVKWTVFEPADLNDLDEFEKKNL